MHVAVCFRALLLITLFGSGSSSLEWTLQSFLGHSHNLYCDDLTTNITAPEIGHWILPSGIPAAADGRHYEIVTRFNIRGYILQVTNITREMSGVYICEIRRADGTTRTRVLRGLNLSGPKFHHWLDKYTNNFIRGAVAAACLLVPMLSVCFVQKYRYRAEEELVNSNGSQTSAAYGNEAFDDIEKKSDNIDTRM